MNEVWLPENGYKGSSVHCRKVHVHETASNSGWVEFTKQGWEEHLVIQSVKDATRHREDTSNGDDMISEGGCL